MCERSTTERKPFTGSAGDLYRKFRSSVATYRRVDIGRHRVRELLKMFCEFIGYAFTKPGKAKRLFTMGEFADAVGVHTVKVIQNPLDGRDLEHAQYIQSLADVCKELVVTTFPLSLQLVIRG